MAMRNIIEDFGITVYDKVLLFDGRKYTEIRYYDWHTFCPLTDSECYDIERAIPADSVYIIQVRKGKNFSCISMHYVL